MPTRYQDVQRNVLTTYYDYRHQAYVVNGHYMACGHPENLRCNCYGRLHAGQAGCHHADVKYIEDGNQGGFARFISVCQGCFNRLPEAG